jgi:putative endonuclease
MPIARQRLRSGNKLNGKVNCYARKRGNEAEQRVCAFLLAQGLVLAKANFQCKFGEIDLICRDGECVVFVEVRWHHDVGFGDSASTVNRAKQKKIINTAKYYLQQNKIFNQVPCRFDVVALSSKNQLEWIKDAFWEE